ncbi:YfhO family protein [Actinospica robiniae]|uniref:YfhO family protein n=1 Tax=Actinospica robiniae TaxID=304901 RepID=UPI00041EFA1D|nr:YfhO family protein [Actinospica robiniae]
MTGETGGMRDLGSGGVGSDLAGEPETLRPEPTTPSAWRSRLRRPRPLSVVAALALALFALWGIGGPLFGTSSLSATGTLTQSGPYPQAGFDDSSGGNALLYDTYTSMIPGTILFKADLEHGHFAGSDPNGDGGGALGSVPDDALLSPLTVPYYVLPTWMGPAYTQLLILICGAGGSFLFLRRLGLSRVAGMLGGLAFAGSGFMVMWVDFPQTRTAAFIPALFWTVERFLQTRRIRDAVLIAVPVASMLLGGFPSVTGYAGVTVCCYALARLLAVRGAEGLRRTVLGGAGVLGGIIAGACLTAFQLLPFQGLMKTWLIIGRSQTSDQHLMPTSVLTTVAPWIFGTGNPQYRGYYLSSNAVESVDYLGAAAVVLVLVALALPWRARPLLPRSVWTFFAAGVVVWLQLLYIGGLPLRVLQDTTVSRALFGQNFIGRSRSILGFLLAVLVAIGFDVVARRRERVVAAAHRLRPWWPATVAFVAFGIAVASLAVGFDEASTTGATAIGHAAAVNLFVHQALYAALFAFGALACVGVLWRTGRSEGPSLEAAGVWRSTRFAAAAVLPVLLAWQSTNFVTQFFPRSPVSTFYPVTDTHAYLMSNLGEDRYASTSTGMVFGTNSAYPVRAVNGHNFIDKAFAAMIDAVPYAAIQYETYIDFAAEQATATSPILDQLGAEYWVSALSDPIFGEPVLATMDGSTLTLQPNQPVTVAVPVTGPLRGVGITPAGTLALGPDDSLDVVVHDGSGTVAHTDRLATGMQSGSQFDVPVAADSVAAGTALTATITWHGAQPLTVEADQGKAAVDAVAGQDDGLRLVHVQDSAIYQRLDAQPRIRWASQSTVVTDQSQRLGLLASGAVGANEVVLSDDAPAASGSPASVTVDEDGDTTVSATVDAEGAGYLVVADSDQAGWKATVDGAAARLRAADQGVVAIAVPAGKHVVTLTYAPPHAALGLAVSGVTLVGLVAAVLGEGWWIRRRRRRRAG